MPASILNVRSLLLAILMLMAGGGYMTTLVSLRLEAQGSGPILIGLVATAYFVGLTLGSLRVPPVIQRVGHIRAFAAFVSLFSASTLTYAALEAPLFWALLRLVDGFCVAGVFVCLESWLNDRAEGPDRGGVLAAYMIFLYSGQALGQQLLNVSGGAPVMAYVTASILISLAVIPVTLTRSAGPPIGENSSFSLSRLYAVSPLGVVGATLTGIMLGAFYGLGPVYARGLGMDLSDTAFFMSLVIVGGIALQWPLGRLSDRFDRRRIIVFAFAGTVGVGVALALVATPGVPLMIAGFLFGGLSFALYPLCVAHTNDHLTGGQRVAASGGLVLLYSAGAAAGPLVGAGAMSAAGPGGLFIAVAVCAAAAVAFGLWRQWARAPVPSERQGAYQILPRTTPMSARLDPRTPDGDSAASPPSDADQSATARRTG
ncbi:MFS transporter [Sphingosinicella sp. CPCC 101087]|uniref:MFS transporter n=1 Tax=Sphingosinicella sp. CPCC 101087 TaxID=2497754 RepID=UPI00101D857A|nr:MFS transporter [Sphingosinicella sp. CPCC 101087]